MLDKVEAFLVKYEDELIFVLLVITLIAVWTIGFEN